MLVWVVTTNESTLGVFSTALRALQAVLMFLSNHVDSKALQHKMDEEVEAELRAFRKRVREYKADLNDTPGFMLERQILALCAKLRADLRLFDSPGAELPFFAWEPFEVE